LPADPANPIAEEEIVQTVDDIESNMDIEHEFIPDEDAVIALNLDEINVADTTEIQSQVQVTDVDLSPAAEEVIPVAKDDVQAPSDAVEEVVFQAIDETRPWVPNGLPKDKKRHRRSISIAPDGEIPNSGLLKSVEDYRIRHGAYKWATIKVKTRVHQIISALQKDSREYWNERCAITATWEEANGITKNLKKKSAKVANDEPDILPLRIKKSKKPQKNNKRIIAHAVRITEAHKTLNCVNATINRRPYPAMQYSNPPKRLKRIEDEKVVRRLPQPDSKDERMENILTASVMPTYIPMLQNPNNSDIIIHLDDDDDLLLIDPNPDPNVFFRKGGLKRPIEDEDSAEPRTRPRWI
jgi:hypothetical protein